MKSIFKSFIAAFSMYSVLPFGLFIREKDGLDKSSLAYVFCFFPLIGLLIGFVEYLWLSLSISSHIKIDTMLFAAVACVIPVILSGGIHLDGYIDTVDAMMVADPKKRREVLKDPHVGAFGLIYTIVYFILIFGAFEQLCSMVLAVDINFMLYMFMLSRILTGLVVLNMKSAKPVGILKTFTENSARWKVNICLIVYLIVLAIFLFYSLHYKLFVALIIVLSVHFLIFHLFCYKKFEGISGDLAGFYLVTAEVVMLLTLAIIR